MLKRRQKSLQNVEYILEHLRYEDFEELKALWGEKWKEETIRNIMGTDFLVLVGVADNPVVMGGIWEIGEEEPKVACVWLLSTEEVSRYKVSLFREMKKEIKKAEKKYSVLFNFIYKTNTKAKRWLRLLGFRFDNPFPEKINVPEGFEFFYKLSG